MSGRKDEGELDLGAKPSIPRSSEGHVAQAWGRGGGKNWRRNEVRRGAAATFTSEPGVLWRDVGAAAGSGAPGGRS